MKDAYLNGIVLAAKWVADAQMSGNVQMEKMFQRILDGAIEKYKDQFGPDLKEK